MNLSVISMMYEWVPKDHVIWSSFILWIAQISVSQNFFLAQQKWYTGQTKSNNNEIWISGRQIGIEILFNSVFFPCVINIPPVLRAYISFVSANDSAVKLYFTSNQKLSLAVFLRHLNELPRPHGFLHWCRSILPSPFRESTAETDQYSSHFQPASDTPDVRVVFSLIDPQPVLHAETAPGDIDMTFNSFYQRSCQKRNFQLLL
jgi:hypothetical protein